MKSNGKEELYFQRLKHANALRPDSFGPFQHFACLDYIMYFISVQAVP